MTKWLTWAELADHWRVSRRHAQTIAAKLGITPVYLAPATPRFPLSAVLKAEKRANS